MFWQTIKPFITNKNGLSNNSITLINNNSIVTDEKILTSIFNDHYINIVEKTTGVKPFSLNNEHFKNKDEIILNIVKKYEKHQSILEINKKILNNEESSQLFTFKETSQNEVLKLFKELNINTSTGEDKIPPKLVKLASQYLVQPLTNAINSSIRSCFFLTTLKGQL